MENTNNSLRFSRFLTDPTTDATKMHCGGKILPPRTIGDKNVFIQSTSSFWGGFPHRKLFRRCPWSGRFSACVINFFSLDSQNMCPCHSPQGSPTASIPPPLPTSPRFAHPAYVQSDVDEHQTAPTPLQVPSPLSILGLSPVMPTMLFSMMLTAVIFPMSIISVVGMGNAAIASRRSDEASPKRPTCTFFLGTRPTFTEGKEPVYVTMHVQVKFQPPCAQTRVFKFEFSPHYKTRAFFSLPPIMAGTRSKNKNTHPAAPVMTDAAKIKAGIPPANRRVRKQTKNDQIRELQARLAAVEHPDEVTAVSKEPLFMRDSSPIPEDVDLFEAESEVPTEVDADDFAVVGGKRASSSSYDPRSLKRTKAYTSFNELRPTIHNKPSGLVDNWPRALIKPSSATRRRSSPLTPSTPSSSTQALSASPSPLASWPPQSSPVTPNFHSFDPIMSTPDTVTPFFGHPSLPFHLDTRSHQPINNASQQFFQSVPTPDTVYSLPRKYKDVAGKTQAPGVKDLPPSIYSGFRNIFIRHIMKLVFSDVSPWSNPSLSVYQHEFDLVYSPLRYHLQTGDAVTHPTNRELGVLRYHIGAEALTAVIEYLPRQYTKRMLASKVERAAYITTLLESKQRPFIWEYFRPGTIEIPRGEETYYDEKRRGPFQSIPVLRAFSVYYTSHGIQAQLPSEDPGRPIGALALAATAVERGYLLHRSGDYVSGGNEFSSTNWLRTTIMYIDKIKNLTDDNWEAIFKALDQLEETLAREAQIEAGIVPGEHEPLLPADPPSPPSV